VNEKRGDYTGGFYCLHKESITNLCCGNCKDKVSANANSKSAKSNPGATVHPTKENSLSSAGLLANQ
jgi:hypothetical protein